jgi:hypothetical protein
VRDSLARLRLRWQAAQVAHRHGRHWQGIRRLLRVLSGFLYISEDYCAALVFLDLVSFCKVDQRRRMLARRELRRAQAAFARSSVLHQRVRGVLALVGFALRTSSPCADEVLLNVRRYLEEARHTPTQPFRPTTAPVTVLDWDRLSPSFRRTICREVEVDALVGDLSAEQLCLAQQDLISWRYESSHWVRIVFPPESEP